MQIIQKVRLMQTKKQGYALSNTCIITKVKKGITLATVTSKGKGEKGKTDYTHTQKLKTGLLSNYCSKSTSI